MQEQICALIRAGNYLATSARIVGIGSTTLHEWLARGEGTDTRESTPLYADFAVAVRKAEAESQAVHVQNIRKVALEGQWTASAWLLERKWPELFSKREAVALTGPTGGPVEMNIDINAETVREAQAALQEAGVHVINGSYSDVDEVHPALPDG
jgi:hypothetical protein